MMLDRNNLFHMYEEQTSRNIYHDIKEKYLKEFEKLKEKIWNIEKRLQKAMSNLFSWMEGIKNEEK